MTTTTKTAKQIHKSFRLFDFHAFDDKKEESTDFTIQMFGINELGETCCVYINDFKPFLYVLVPPTWNIGDALIFFNELKKKVGNMASSLLNIELKKYNKLYGFTAGGKELFACITFSNLAAKNRVANLWYVYDDNNKRRKQNFKYGKHVLEIYESSIPPLLRYFHIENISPSGWVSLNVSKMTAPNYKTTTCKYEFITSQKYITPQPDKEVLVPYKICSFDIEASSSHGDFPVPVKTYKRLATNMVDVFYKHKVQTKEVGNKFIEKTILTAFGESTFDDIDLVYPKIKPSKTEIMDSVKLLLTTPISKIKKNKKAISSLTIDNVFSKVKNSFSNVERDDDGEMDDGGEESDLEEEVEENEMEEENDFEENDFEEKEMEETVSTTINGHNYLTDILIKPEFNREEKIKQLNDSLTSLFPELEGDKTTFIGSTFVKYGEPEPYLNHCIVVGSCSQVEGATIKSVETEKDLLLEWASLIQTENPDIIIGYNIFGFDYEFLFRRSKENECEHEFLKLSRTIGHVSANFNKDTEELTLDNTKICLATGEYDLYYPKMLGRFQVDLLVYFRKEFNLSSYKLDNVSGQFIGDTINQIEYLENETILYCKNTTGLNKNDYIHIELSEFTSDYFMDGKKFSVREIKEMEIMEMDKKKNELVPIKYKQIIIEKIDERIDFSIKTVKWGLAKDDVSVQDIFRLTKGSSEDRAIVAKYCIQDCNIVHHLMRKIDVLVGFIEMSRICSVPMSYLVLRGQGIKLTSFVAKKCREKETLMPDIEKSELEDGYEGAIVLPPKCAMYIDNPVACLDYSSLYPSNMISQNLSHDSKVWTKEYDLKGVLIHNSHPNGSKYDNLPDYHYVDVEFDTYKYVKKTPQSKKATKVKCGKKVCRWAQFPDGKKGILPSILEELLKARKSTKKQGEQEKDEFMKNILDKRQLAYKATANSLYGQCGSKTSTFYEKDIAASTTAVGRLMITYAKKMIEEIYGDAKCETSQGAVLTKAEYVYGDSVANYTPVYIRHCTEPLEIITIEDLAVKYGNNHWVFSGEKEFCELSNIETWSEMGWTPLERIIRHKLAPEKKMIRILTHTGVVDATDDHSLLTVDKMPISPKNVDIGTELLHSEIPFTCLELDSLSKEEAKIMGFFMGDGSCGSYDCPSGKKSGWALNNASMVIIEKYQKLCQEVYPEFEWVVCQTLKSSGVYKIQPRNSKYGSIRDFVLKYRNWMYYEKSKIIPTIIFQSNKSIREAFWEGLYDADGDKTQGNIRIDRRVSINQKNQLSAAHIYRLAKSFGWNVSINTRTDKLDVYRINATKNVQRKSAIKITPFSVENNAQMETLPLLINTHEAGVNDKRCIKISEIPYPEGEYVYDLTTVNHHFSAGIGELVVHNTDSVFFTFQLENPQTHEKIVGKKALEITIELAQEVAKLCTQFLIAPMELSYEKTLMPFILLSKKRYVGMLYETNANKGKLKFMGLSLKRRDACDYLKDVYGGILNILMRSGEINTIKNAIDFLELSLNNLITGKVPMEKLEITKALRSDYKNPERIGHKVLAERIGDRDPGNKPKSGDRIKYVFIKNANPKALVGDRIETPEFIVSSKIKVDYKYYITNQLMKPLQQLFGLALEDIWKFKGKLLAISSFKKEMKVLFKDCNEDLEIFMKKKEKITSKYIKTLLFDKFLTEILNSQNRNKTINFAVIPTRP